MPKPTPKKSTQRQRRRQRISATSDSSSSDSSSSSSNSSDSPSSSESEDEFDQLWNFAVKEAAQNYETKEGKHTLQTIQRNNVANFPIHFPSANLKIDDARSSVANANTATAANDKNMSGLDGSIQKKTVSTFRTINSNGIGGKESKNNNTDIISKNEKGSNGNHFNRRNTSGGGGVVDLGASGGNVNGYSTNNNTEEFNGTEVSTVPTNFGDSGGEMGLSGTVVGPGGLGSRGRTASTRRRHTMIAHCSSSPFNTTYNTTYSSTQTQHNPLQYHRKRSVERERITGISPTRSTVDTIISDFSSLCHANMRPDPDAEGHNSLGALNISGTSDDNDKHSSISAIEGSDAAAQVAQAVHSAVVGGVSGLSSSPMRGSSRPSSRRRASFQHVSYHQQQQKVQNDQYAQDPSHKPSSQQPRYRHTLQMPSNKTTLKHSASNVSLSSMNAATKMDAQREVARYIFRLRELHEHQDLQHNEYSQYNEFHDLRDNINNVDDMKNPITFPKFPIIFEVIAHKETKKQLSGLVLSRGSDIVKNGGGNVGAVLVKDITSQSIFASGRLQLGHEILAINDHRVKCPKRAAGIMRSIQGEVRLLVSEGWRPPGTRYIRVRRLAGKPSRGREVGGDKGDVSGMRSGISHDGLSTMIAEMNNNDEIVQYQRRRRSVSFDGERRRSTGNEEYNDGNAVCDAATNLGIHLETREGIVRVTYIDPKGSFSNSSIYRGDVVLTINGIAVCNAEQALKLLLTEPEKTSNVQNKYDKQQMQEANTSLSSSKNKHPVGGLISMLIYSMLDLRTGLIDQIVPPSWTTSWSADQECVTLIQNSGSREYTKFDLNFLLDGTCQCIDPLRPLDRDVSQMEKDRWVNVFNDEVQPEVTKVNDVVYLVGKLLREAMVRASSSIVTYENSGSVVPREEYMDYQDNGGEGALVPHDTQTVTFYDKEWEETHAAMAKGAAFAAEAANDAEHHAGAETPIQEVTAITWSEECATSEIKKRKSSQHTAGTNATSGTYTTSATSGTTGTLPTDDSSLVTEESNEDVIPVRSVVMEKGASIMGTIRKELELLQQKYHPRRVKLVDTYNDSIYVHMVVRLDDALEP